MDKKLLIRHLEIKILDTKKEIERILDIPTMKRNVDYNKGQLKAYEDILETIKK